MQVNQSVSRFALTRSGKIAAIALVLQALVFAFLITDANSRAASDRAVISAECDKMNGWLNSNAGHPEFDRVRRQYMDCLQTRMYVGTRAGSDYFVWLTLVSVLCLGIIAYSWRQAKKGT